MTMQASKAIILPEKKYFFIDILIGPLAFINFPNEKRQLLIFSIGKSFEFLFLVLLFSLGGALFSGILFI